MRGNPSTAGNWASHVILGLERASSISAMSHLRLNAKSTSPNPYFNFITALPSFLNAPGLPSQQNAKELLDALAAQVRPICKKHGFAVNSFEEVSHKLFPGHFLDIYSSDPSMRYVFTETLLVGL